MNRVTGQVDFDSHTRDLQVATVTVVNLVQPGYRHGRLYAAEISPGEINECLTAAGRQFLPYRPTISELESLRAYTSRLYAVFRAVDADDLDRACATVNELTTETRATPILARRTDGPWHLHFHPADADWASGWVAGMATSVALMLGSADAERLGICSASRCDRVFIDTSRNGTRRFCSSTCQNRAKTAAFRARQNHVPP